jgi:predicted GH43/DUF377 family glycosyl hydrolase
MLNRFPENPILTPSEDNMWEAQAAFNPCVVNDKDKVHLLYRALSIPENIKNINLPISSIGYTSSVDGINFQERRQLIKPEHNWEIFGCEDPRITKLDDKFYIFYTALASYPFQAGGIKIGMATTKDFITIDSKHLVTTFNSKAMTLFPEKINGKIAAILTVHTDIPPAKIALAFFDKEEQIWSTQYWNEWYATLDHHVIPLLRDSRDHLEVGAPPLKTKDGWLIVYSYIQNYTSSDKSFGIEAVLLDLKNPSIVTGRTEKALLIPEMNYELKGDVPNVIFPSGAYINEDRLFVYYGAADTSGCLATMDVNELLKELTQKKKPTFVSNKTEHQFERYSDNPIISPRPEFQWEAKATFNPAAIYEDGKVHIIYRAMSHDDTSVFGYAVSSDGVHIDERLSEPIFTPKEIFEQKLTPGNSGCEDPRITKMGDRFYLFYVACDGYTPRVAFTSILISDFLNRWWNWDRPKVISSPLMPDKDACILAEKINNKYAIFHRAYNDIYIDYVDDLNFLQDEWLLNKLSLIKPSPDKDDKITIAKVGMSAPPIKSEYGWLLLYHWVEGAQSPYQYNVGVALLDLNNPSIVLKKDVLLMEPETKYEKFGIVPNVVFPCGAVLIKNEIFIYYGGADKVIGVAKISMQSILETLGI